MTSQGFTIDDFQLPIERRQANHQSSISDLLVTLRSSLVPVTCGPQTVPRS
jgi:hypothetical protein